ncbi:hypothetical protein ABH930_001127 [Kitasatospora sp. GAS204A]|uniref:hypothetical protein n=1 Tax=unclassified Kitasatospora TaxID=2633591 RepID=UPI002473DADE|nr:hypothetical protein [Kitasatospora sp. GAS204B]MDH6119887.1 hypothetical protein [Kitasatospora sp. GAS204B]
MAVIAVTGGLGAPGATTSALALLLAWPLAAGRKMLLAECDPDGGAVLAGALEGRVEAVYGLRNLAVADRRGLLAQSLWDQLIDISPDGEGSRLLLPGLTDPAQAAGLAYTWEPLVEELHALDSQGYDVLLDLGRSGAFGAGAVLARRADAVVATVRTTLRGLSAARPRLAALREDLESAGTGGDALGLLLIAEGPYPAADVTRQLDLPVLGVLPYAVRTARVLSDGGDSTDRRFIRSELMRTARTAADRIQGLVEQRRARLSRLVPLIADEPSELFVGTVGAVGDAGVPMPAAGAGWGVAPERQSPDYAGAAMTSIDQGDGYRQPYAPPSGEVFVPPEYQQPYQPAAVAPVAPAPVWSAPVPPAPAQPGHMPPAYAAPPYPEPARLEPMYPALPFPEPTYPAPAFPEPAPGGQAFASPVGQVYVPSAGPVQVVPGPVPPGQSYPPLAGIAPHPAAPEPFPGPTEEAETQGEVLRAR